MTALAIDIGGTHARIAEIVNGELVRPEKYAVLGHDDFAALLENHCRTRRITASGSLRIATAACADASDPCIFRFTNNSAMLLDLDGLRNRGWTVEVIVNDFVASAYGTIDAGSLDARVLYGKARCQGLPWMVMGPGTGLGLAYGIPLSGGRHHVQETFGGHMLAAAATPEQRNMLDSIATMTAPRSTVVPEDTASGRGLMMLYRAVCGRQGIAPTITDTAALIAQPHITEVRETFRLFHEFLGLFAHQALVSGHAFGGLYIDGGIAAALYSAGLFDLETFRRFLILDGVPVVKAALAATPIWLIDDPFIALRGLLAISA